MYISWFQLFTDFCGPQYLQVGLGTGAPVPPTNVPIAPYQLFILKVKIAVTQLGERMPLLDCNLGQGISKPRLFKDLLLKRHEGIILFSIQCLEKTNFCYHNGSTFCSCPTFSLSNYQHFLNLYFWRILHCSMIFRLSCQPLIKVKICIQNKFLLELRIVF